MGCVVVVYCRHRVAREWPGPQVGWMVNRLIRCYARNLKTLPGPLRHIVVILIGFSTGAETDAFLPIVLHSPAKLERNKRGRASQSGPIVAHTVASRVC